MESIQTHCLTFRNNKKQWWSAKKGYVSRPKEVSQLKLMHKILMKNPSDDLYLGNMKKGK